MTSSDPSSKPRFPKGRDERPGARLVVLGLGSNVEGPEQIDRAIERLTLEYDLLVRSTRYVGPPEVPSDVELDESAPPYSNAAVLIRTADTSYLAAALEQDLDVPVDVAGVESLPATAGGYVDYDCVVLENVALTLDMTGDSKAALPVAQQSLELRREQGDRAGVARMLSRVSAIHESTGNYDAATLTPLERPPQFGDRAYLTQQEAAEIAEQEQYAQAKGLEKSDANREAPPAGGSKVVGLEHTATGGNEFGAGNVGAYNLFWIDRGTDTYTIDGKIPTSIIIDPPNGRMPSMTPEAMGKPSCRYWS